MANKSGLNIEHTRTAWVIRQNYDLALVNYEPQGMAMCVDIAQTYVRMNVPAGKRAMFLLACGMVEIKGGDTVPAEDI